MTLSTEYDAVHKRLRKARGSASALSCAAEDCDEPAAVWAWQHTGPSRTATHRHGRVVTWGTDTEDYAPMCLSHAGQLDRGGTLTHCPRGHDRAVGKDAKGLCLTCKQEDWRSPKRLARLRANYKQKEK